MPDWPILSPLSEDEKRQVLVLARRRRFQRGEVVVHRDDPADTMHLVQTGSLAVRVLTPLGDVATLAIVGVFAALAAGRPIAAGRWRTIQSSSAQTASILLPPATARWPTPSSARSATTGSCSSAPHQAGGVRTIGRCVLIG